MATSAGQSHYNSVLTAVSVNFTPPDLAARELLKPIKVEKESDVFPVYDKSAFDRVDDQRADGAESNETDLGWKYDQYLCQEHALKTILTKRQIDNSDDPADMEARKTENIKQKVLNNLEAMVFATGGFARLAANVQSSTNLNWSNPATASPRTDTDAMKETIEAASGLSPNTIVLTPQVARAIMRTAEWRDEAKYTNDLRADNDIPTQFYGLNVVLVKSLLNTAVRGQAKTLARVMGEDVLICYIAPGGLGQNTLTWAALLYTEEYANKWYDDDRRGWIIEYGMVYTPKLIAKECAALGTSVLTA